MLQVIRDKAQGIFIWCIILFICASFALWGVHNYLGGNNANSTVAKVNGVTIVQHDLKSAYDRINRQEQATLGNNYSATPSADTRRRQQALQELIDVQMLTSAAQKEGYRISTTQTENALWHTPDFQENGKFSREKFEQYLNNAVSSLNSFLSVLSNQLLLSQVYTTYANSAFMTPMEVNDGIKLIAQKRDINYLIIPMSNFQSGIEVSTAEEQNYYQQHQKDFVTPEQVSIQYLQLSLQQLMAQLHFSKQELNDFYEKNINSFKQPARWNIAQILIKVPVNANDKELAAIEKKASALYQQLQAGESFASLAEHNSDDVITAKQGGALGWISHGMLGPRFEQALLQLKKKGDITLPVRTEYGFNIIKLIDIQPEKTQPFADTKDRVQKLLAEQKAQQLFSDASEQLSDLTYRNSGSLTEAAKALNLPILTSKLFSRQGGTDTLTHNPKVIDAAFTAEVLQQGYNSNPIQIDDQTLIVLRVQDHKAATQQTFAEVQAKIASILSTEKAKVAAQNLGEKILQQLHNNANPQMLAQQNKLEWKSQKGLGRVDLKFNNEILASAFRLPRPTPQNMHPDQGFSLKNGDYVILSLVALHDGILNPPVAPQRRQFQAELERNLGDLDYQLYIVSLKQQAKITIEQNIQQNNDE